MIKSPKSLRAGPFENILSIFHEFLANSNKISFKFHIFTEKVNNGQKCVASSLIFLILLGGVVAVSSLVACSKHRDQCQRDSKHGGSGKG